ncbi:helix-turn-helix domain-containing protein [Clostridium cylindrosporum]|uniref:HTH cro/C1-type domain-containing protein n=1 Tax=Clostridium cylindrosporum DSM 605 TaxID=1121307 RepID=A0A0J8DB48_CLOCY|nr:helix-turn-helix transcriptional regulator [Clostridium cylindrosporum]KMT21503.1 hypothetical protein CLCY_2c02640 [Clostridium cylindrosporum DSM 605]
MLSPEKLKMLRLVHGVTLQNVGDEMGVSKNYISMIENRKVSLSEEQYHKLVDAIYAAHRKKNSKQEDVEENIEAVKEEMTKKKTTTKKTTKK